MALTRNHPLCFPSKPFSLITMSSSLPINQGPVTDNDNYQVILPLFNASMDHSPPHPLNDPANKELEEHNVLEEQDRMNFLLISSNCSPSLTGMNGLSGGSTMSQYDWDLEDFSPHGHVHQTHISRPFLCLPLSSQHSHHPNPTVQVNDPSQCAMMHLITQDTVEVN